MTNLAPVLAVDIGGTKTAVAIVHGTAGTHKTVRFPTPRSAPDALQLLLRHCRNLLSDTPVAAIGVSFGGHVFRDRVRSLHVPGWEDIDLVGVLGSFAHASVGLLNDAEAGALAEYQARQRRPHAPASLLYVTVSTGIGGAIVIDGDLHRGDRGLAGEIGHLPVGGTAACACGGAGHLESVAAGPAIAWLARSGLGEVRHAESVLHEVRHLDARAVALAAERGDTLARETLQETGSRLGAALIASVLCLDPAVICLGGGVAQSGRDLWDPLRETLHRHPLVNTPVERALHGGDSALVGAGLHGLALANRAYSEAAP